MIWDKKRGNKTEALLGLSITIERYLDEYMRLTQDTMSWSKPCALRLYMCAIFYHTS
jgi:hypothetical protein